MLPVNQNTTITSPALRCAVRSAIVVQQLLFLPLVVMMVVAVGTDAQLFSQSFRNVEEMLFNSLDSHVCFTTFICFVSASGWQ